MNGFRHRQPDVILVDVDSTLADTRPRRLYCPTVDPAYTWTDYAMECADDQPIAGTVRAVQLFARAGFAIHLVTYRPYAARVKTIDWLRRYDVPYHRLRMRTENDTGDSTSYKLGYLRAVCELGFTPAQFIEDWPETAAAIEAAGVPVLCVNPRYTAPPV